MIRVVIAEDEKLFLEMLEMTLEAAPDIEVVGVAKNGKEALSLVKSEKPDVLITDFYMPYMDGLELSRVVRRTHPDVKIVVVTHNQQLPAFQSFVQEVKVEGCLFKVTEGRDDFIRATRAVAAGGSYFSDDVEEALALMPVNRQPVRLSRREKEVLRLIVQERSSDEIARELQVSPHTVAKHRKNMFNKTGARNSNGLVVYALMNGIVDEEPNQGGYRRSG